MLTELPVWHKLTQHYQTIKSETLRQLFAANPQRAEQFSLSAADLFLDYSKNRITSETLELLIQLAEQSDLNQSIQQLFTGHSINFTENRPALHTALRTKEPTAEIRTMHAKMAQLVQALQQQQWLGFSGLPITDVVNIGIGGSDLGPRLCVDALRTYQNKTVKVHFVSNIDGNDIFQTLQSLNPATTLFIVASKSFTTIETLTNARTAKTWLLAQTKNEPAIAQHFIAVTAKPDLAVKFGISIDNIFSFWDWVGGRYSLWSSIGLPIAIAIGMENFSELLAGAYTMDEHFRNAPFAHNMPVILALLSIWYVNFFHAHSQAVIPYDQRLKLLPAYLQQLEMESNGKIIDKNDLPITYATAPIIWGDVGTNGQHAFHQLLHQGSTLVPVDFLLAKKSAHPYQHQHDLLIANCLAQSEALMMGRTEQEALTELADINPAQAKKLAKHKVIPGNKPSNTILFPELSPRILGSMIALYEHKIFVEGIIWHINSFDQYGVELGKTLANQVVEPNTQNNFSGSTQKLLDRIKSA
jgi:glucose-6-phosphate isomerase